MRSLLLLALPACAASDDQNAVDDQVVYAVLDTEVYLYGQNLIGLLSVSDRGEDGEVSVVRGEWCGRAVEF